MAALDTAVKAQLLRFHFTEKEITTASKLTLNYKDINNVLNKIDELKLKNKWIDDITSDAHQNDDEYDTQTDAKYHPPFICPKLPSKQLMNMIIASHSIATQNGFLVSCKRTLKHREENHVKYIVGMTQNQGEKPVNFLSKHTKQHTNISSTKNDPFIAPFMEASHICDLNKDYRLLLNKYPVLPYHLLIITKQFVHQEILLTATDFDVTFKVFESIINDGRNQNSLIYFNSGKCAGATQQHRHLQILPNVDVGKYLLLNIIYDEIKNAANQQVAIWKKFPFLHGIITWKETDSCDGYLLYKYYILIMDFIKKYIVNRNKFSYNMLITNKMMMIVPRKCGAFVDDKRNEFWFSALPFGGLICCSTNYMKIFNAAGLMKVLRYCCFPRNNVVH